MIRLCDQPDTNVPLIIEEWRNLTDRSPWNELTETGWLNHLPQLLHILIAVTRGAPEPQLRKALVKCAASHGVNRRNLTFDADVMLEEYYLLRKAAWNCLHVDAANARDLSQATGDIVRLDAAITVATLASMIGFYTKESAQAGTWPHALAELADGWQRLAHD